MNLDATYMKGRENQKDPLALVGLILTRITRGRLQRHHLRIPSSSCTGIDQVLWEARRAGGMTVIIKNLSSNIAYAQITLTLQIMGHSSLRGKIC